MNLLPPGILYLNPTTHSDIRTALTGANFVTILGTYIIFAVAIFRKTRTGRWQPAANASAPWAL